jgi:hypothetical protein
MSFSTSFLTPRATNPRTGGLFWQGTGRRPLETRAVPVLNNVQGWLYYLEESFLAVSSASLARTYRAVPSNDSRSLAQSCDWLISG